MQSENDVVVRGILAAHSHAARRLKVLAANSGAMCKHARIRAVAGMLLAISALACGDERSPWSGFPVFPPDAGGFELSPELASSLRAAEVAFVTQLAAEQGLTTPGAATTSGASANATDAGARASRMNAAPDKSPQPADAPPAPAEAANAAGAGARAASERWRQPRAPDAGAVLDAAGSGAAGASAPPTQPAAPDAPDTNTIGSAGVSGTAAGPQLEAGVAMTAAGAGGRAGGTAPNNAELDASTPLDSADSGI